MGGPVSTVPEVAIDARLRLRVTVEGEVLCIDALRRGAGCGWRPTRVLTVPLRVSPALRHAIASAEVTALRATDSADRRDQ